MCDKFIASIILFAASKKKMEKKILTILSLIIVALIGIYSCANEEGDNKKLHQEPTSIIGTWKLISGTTIKGKDTIVTDYTQNQEMIKIINETHFSFLRHDLKNGRDSNAIYVAGGGKYTLKGNKYIEHLDYFNIREWEGNSFELEYKIDNDTLITKGMEKIEGLNVDYLNIEKYYRVSK